MKGITYQRIYNWCQRQEPQQSISGYIEQLIAADLAGREPLPTELTAITRKKKQAQETEKIASGHFTF